ncbi:REQUIRED FOR ACCD RNA EDITING 1 [Hibiscus trionum]|uniref:REQUIRED FOR ACCD RNA EDITING 1 n=1 Tax=Hibiscus trionum TaxID=183268 RepID=A0A9W7LPF4_HIBTR|nr:REQUIRED FOR ACCD RNA EDITING 1 [Hibiscus trionum]
MANTPLPPSIPATRFARIPSWVSLKSSSSSSLKIPQNQQQQGQVENVHLLSLSKQGKLKEAREFLKQMDGAGVPVNPGSYKSLLQTCSNMRSLSDGRLIHQRLPTTMGIPSRFLDNCVLQMYCLCESFQDAEKLFDEMPDKNLASWVTLISAYSEKGHLEKALGLFSQMIELGIELHSAFFTSLLKSLLDPSVLEIGKQLHSLVIRIGLSTDVSVITAISNMYVKCRELERAKLVFDQMVERNVAGWTGLMMGYTQAGKEKHALVLFVRMLKEGVELDKFVFSIALKACAGLEDLNLGRQIHGYIVKLGLESEVFVGTPVVDLYVKCSHFDSATRAFERISEPNDASWSAIITGYCQIGKLEKSLQIFQSLRTNAMAINSFIYTSIFQTCSALADYNMGAQAHADAIKRGLVSYLHGESALITFYSKCGRLDYANRAFESIDEPDTVAWTAIICGHAYHGNASEALKLFKRMENSTVKPNEVTFVGVLTACSHSGFITEAKLYLESMSHEYGVKPTIDHYDCMVDAYSRAGLLQEAYELIKNMPFEPDAMSWKCLLGGCWIHRNLELGETAAKNLLQLDPDDTAGYILMFNLYASHGKWEEAARVRSTMGARKLKKELSCSWITVKGKVHRFVVGDKHHPQTENIYGKLKELNHSFMDVESVLLKEEDVSFGLPERKQQLTEHSERLAIAFGLISAPSNAPIIIFKNLRACKNCHDFAKHVSMVTGRGITIRDSCRFHHFHMGKCSCNDYW